MLREPSGLHFPPGPGERTHSPISQIRISRQTEVQNRASFARLANGLGSRIRHGIAKQRDLWEVGLGQRTWDGAETDWAKRKQGESLGGVDLVKAVSPGTG